MLRVVPLNLVALVTSLLATALHVQVPLQSSDRWADERPIVLDNDNAAWSLGELPNPNTTDHLVFETVHSLLQHWPNTRMRKGHTIVPGIIPKGTLLYHGTSRNEVPPGPEWVAMDPEYAYFFCWDSWSAMPSGNNEPRGEEKCWYLTLATTRPLRVVYFDGSSSAKFTDGSLDSQDLMAWGESRAEDAYAESKRIKDLCAWVTKFNVDGIARMGMDFEVMLCDFTSGVGVISFLNLEPPNIDMDDLVSGLVPFEMMNAGSWHNRSPGETRILLDIARLVSFYDTQLVPSLVPIRAGQERWDYRLQNISNEDLSAVKSRIEAAFTSPWGSPSGIDWKALIQVIVDRFAQRFELTRHLLNSPATRPYEVIDLANKTQTQLRVMLTPYILLSAKPTDPSDKDDLEWASPIYEHCATTHIRPVESELDRMTDSEKLILQAARGTTREICRVVTKMWAAGVHAGIDASLNTTEGSLDVAEVAELRSEWGADLGRLMAWLDWSIWVKCDPECGPREICYLPTWPVGFPGFPPPLPGQRPPSDAGKSEEGSTSREQLGGIVKPGANEWFRPQPKCISRVDPYEF